MPKLKTNSGAAKRFRKTAKGYKVRRAFRNHILTKKSTKQKRKLRTDGGMVADCHKREVSRMLAQR